jgi:hypothetical protein
VQKKQQDEWREILDGWRRNQLRLLCILYDLDPDVPVVPWKELALRLAERHVPGFRIPKAPPKPKKRRGAPTRYDRLTLALFAVAAVKDAAARYAEKHHIVDKVKLATAINNIGQQYWNELKTPRGKALSPDYIANLYRKGMRLLNDASKGKVTEAEMVRRGFPPLAELAKRHKIPDLN